MSRPCPRRLRPGGCGGGRAPDPDLLQHRDELRAVGCLPSGQDERQRAALAVGGEVDLAGLPAPRASEEGGLQPEFLLAPDAPPLFPLGIHFCVQSVLSFRVAPFDLFFFSSATASSRAASTSWPRCIPAASW